MITSKELLMIIPVWFSPQLDQESVTALLGDTLAGSDRYVPAANLYLYLDGVPYIDETATKTVGEKMPGAVIARGEQNLGKGAGVVAGVRHGLSEHSIRWLMVRDADGDHRAEDAAGLLQLAEQIEAEYPDLPIIVIGGRYRLEPPLTLYRAVYEEILNQCIDASLKYALSKKNYIPVQVYYRQYRRVPDLQSGYKLYNRRAAELILGAFERELDGGFEAYRLGAEVIPYVEVVMNGGVVGERMRSTYREQPVSAYASITRAEFYSKKMAWVYKTCDISLWNAARMLDAEIAYSPLIFDGMGRMELLKFRELTLTALKKRDADEVPRFKWGVDVL